MSSLTTTSINTANGATNLTVGTGNTQGPAIVVTSSTDIALRGNSTANVIIANTTSLIANAAATFNASATFNANAAFNSNVAIVGGVTATTNVSTNTITANTINVVNASITSNTLNFGASSITPTQFANGYTRLPNGLLLQWGTVIADNGSGSVTFPAAFSPVFSMFVTSSVGGTTYTSAVTALSNTTASVRTANSADTTVYWQAIGL